MSSVLITPSDVITSRPDAKHVVHTISSDLVSPNRMRKDSNNRSGRHINMYAKYLSDILGVAENKRTNAK